MAISKSQVSVTSLSTDSDNSRLKNTPVDQSQYLGIFRNAFVSCRRGLSNVVPQKDSLSSTWRPTSLNPILLLSVTFFNALVITVLGILQWKSNRDGGLYVAEKADDIPAAVTFLHLHFPTIIAVAYSVVWSWIDLDVKRLEPWFQMSQASGAEARDSVLLHYPVDFIASVPINAAKRKQWAVVSASTITVALFWALTPLQSAIFSVDTISRTRSIPITVSDSLIPLEQQADQLNVGFLNDGYSVLWLGQDLPPFTTMTSALAPLKIPEYPPVVGLNKTITYPTKRYETALNCYPPVSMEATKTLGITADNGRGCVAENVVRWYERNASIPFRAYYVGYFDDPYAPYSLAMGGCPKNASNTFLAIWRRSSLYKPNFDDPSNATALFCEPSYFTQPVDATVTFPDYSVVGVKPTGPKTTLSDEDFAIRRFHYILGTGAPPRMYENAGFHEDAPERRVIADSTMLYQNTRLQNASIEVPTSNMVGFAIGSSKLSPEEYMNASKLSTSFEAAHQLLFALAAHDVITQPDENQSRINGEEQLTVQAVTLVQTFTFLVQGFLFFIIILTFFLIYVSWNRPMCLASDPNSMSEVMSLSTSTDILDAFKPFDSLGSHELSDKLGGIKFRLLPADITLRNPRLNVSPESRLGSASPNVGSACATTTQQTLPEKPTMRPWELRSPVGVVFIFFLIGSLVAVIILKQKIESGNGLPLPSRNPIVEQLLTNYLPTAIATFMEPWWIVLNRFACLLQPFKDLQRGKATAWHSLSTKYTSLPPQLVSWRAMKARHFLLVVISFTGLLSNILTVSLSGLFIRKTITGSIPIEFRQLYQPRFPKGYPFYNPWDYESHDHYYVAMSNISANTSLPPWVSPNYYYLPVNLPTSNEHIEDGGDTDTQYQLVTTGIGAQLDCLELSEKGSEHRYEFNISRDAIGAKFSTFHKTDDESLLRCDGNAPKILPLETDTSSIRGKPDGRRALEFWPQMAPSPSDRNSSNAGFCVDSFVGGWIRANLTEHPGKTSPREYHNVSINSMEKMFLSCQPRLKFAQFNVRVDATGRILDSAQTGPFDDSLGGNVTYIASRVSELAVLHQDMTWHNDSLGTDWTNYLIKLRTQSDDIVDATAPVPEFNSTATTLNDLYSRLFAILLSLKSNDLVPARQDAPTITGYQKIEEPRLFFSKPMFIVSIIIFMIDIVVALAIYIGFRKPLLPRLPTTIASNIASFAASHIPELLTDNPESTTETRMAELDRQGYRYGLGEFVGTDGKTHLGIERDEFVQRKKDKSNVRRRVKELTKDWV